MTLSQILMSQGHDLSEQALRYAETGAHDALIRIARDKEYTCASADCYTIEFTASGCSNNSACARVSVSAGAGTGGDPKIITAEGQVRGAVRRLQVDVVYDGSDNGEIASTTWKELTS